jgi:hypothetical protein
MFAMQNVAADRLHMQVQRAMARAITVPGP